MQSNFNSNGTRTMERPIRIAIQQNGRLREGSTRFLAAAGLRFDFVNAREFLIPCAGGEVEILCVRNSDIPKYVQFGAADYGIVGENVLWEQNSQLKILKKLGFGQCSVVIAAPEGSATKTIADLLGERIATAYPNTLRKFLRKNNIDASVIEIKGKVEVTPRLGLADAICEIVQTGRTLEENNLAVIETIFDSEAVLVESSYRDGKSLF